MKAGAGGTLKFKMFIILPRKNLIFQVLSRSNPLKFKDPALHSLRSLGHLVLNTVNLYNENFNNVENYLKNFQELELHM